MHESAAVRLLGLWVRIPPGAWMAVSCGCWVLSGRGLCDRPIIPPGEYYRMYITEYDRRTSYRRPKPTRAFEP